MIKMFSKAAKDLEMYLVINMPEMMPCNDETMKKSPWIITKTTSISEECPEHGYIFHNVEVVFDRQGTVITRLVYKYCYISEIQLILTSNYR